MDVLQTKIGAEIAEHFIIAPAEWAIIGIGIFVHTFNLIVACYILYNRHYPPLRIKQIPLVIIALIAGIIWWVGGMATLRLFPQTNNPVLTICELWSVWVQIVFGLTLWVCCLEFRFWTLYWIVILQKAANNWRFNITFFIFYAPIVVYGIVATILKVDGPHETINGNLVCQFDAAALYIFIALLALYILLVIFFMIKLRNIKLKYLQEFTQTRISVLIFCTAYVGYIVVLGTGQQYYIWGRCFNTMIVLGIPTAIFYIQIGAPAYHCLFNREEYEAQFRAQRDSISIGTKKSVEKTIEKLEENNIQE